MSRLSLACPLARRAASSGDPVLCCESRLTVCCRRVLCFALAGISAWCLWGPAAPGQVIVQSPSPLLGRPSGTVEKLIDQGRLDEASAALEGRFNAEGSTARNLLLRGLLSYRRERYEDALVDLRQSFALDEDDPSTSKALGLCLVKLGREDLAETFFEIVTQLAPGDYMGRYYLGLNFYTTKRFELATREFERALDLEPGSVDVQGFLGRSYEAQGEIEKASEHYLTAVDLNRKREQRSGTPPLLLGSMLFRQKELDRAESLLREALRYDQQLALAHYWLGLLLEQRAELPSAILALDRAAALAPTDHRPHYALARIHRRVGDDARAAEAVRKFRELRARSESETF